MTETLNPMETLTEEATNQGESIQDGKPAEIVSFSQIRVLKRKALETSLSSSPILENAPIRRALEREESLSSSFHVLSEEGISTNSCASIGSQSTELGTESSRSPEDSDLSRSGSQFVFNAGKPQQNQVDKVGDADLWSNKVKKGYSKFVATMNNKTLAKLYKEARGLNWTEESIDLTTDTKDFERLDPKEQKLLKLVLSFFARSDGLVNENLVMNFYQKITIPEARLFYGFQIYIEGIHALTYTRLIEALVTEEKERKILLRKVNKYKSVAKKEAWIKKWIESGNPLAESLLAFVCVEGIFFSAAFCVIYWFKQYKKALLPGLIKSNNFIARDEKLHCRFGIELFKLLKNKLSKERAYEIIESAIECEIDFAREAIKEPMDGMSSESMIQYVKFVADSWLEELEYDLLYGVPNPFDWMTLIEVPPRANFFEVKAHEYVSGTKLQ